MIATRAHGLAAMQAFVPAMGRRYAEARNFDLGPGRHNSVSGLSPYVRRRLVTEREIVAAALAAHGPDASEKFVQEVVWRTYFKGWLEQRPQVWAGYRNGLRSDLSALEDAPDLKRIVARAEQGETGLACLDAWARELVKTGYLHNHARMWFASIWIFTLKLPWRLGADFFYRHLLDGDAASNTLGWRWVAGLHTRGKAYFAEASNIATFTQGRFTPCADELASPGSGLEAEEPEGLPPLMPLRPVALPRPAEPCVLLITDEDCTLEDVDSHALDIRAAATLSASHLRSPLAVSEAIAQFDAAALSDAASRAGVAATPLRAGDPHEFADWVAATGASKIVTPYVTRGPLHDWLSDTAKPLQQRGIALSELRRDWDTRFWPHATAGFFKVKQQIPRLMREMRLA